MLNRNWMANWVAALAKQAVPLEKRVLPLARASMAVALTGFLAGALVLPGCDSQRIAELEEGVANESDVKAKFGEPDKVWEAAGGGRMLEFNRQPEGTTNYMITIGPDGKMSALRQVLTAANFAKVTPGMPLADVRKMLGRPMKITPFEQKGVTHYDWRWADGPNGVDSKIFTAVFNADQQVVASGSVPDLRAARPVN
jgi:hypothetical protein